MKNIFVIIVTLLVVMSCMKTKQRYFHHKNWKNIQGTWDIEDAWEDGVSIVDSIKKSYCDIYSLSIIRYQNDRERDGLLHLYNNSSSDDFGAIFIEANKYKKIQICKLNFNIVGNSNYYPCINQFNLFDTCILWNIDELTSTNLIISSPIRGKFYKVKYEKK
jgi:hypothetical protein